jgi:hypothetical protein
VSNRSVKTVLILPSVSRFITRKIAASNAIKAKAAAVLAFLLHDYNGRASFVEAVLIDVIK